MLPLYTPVLYEYRDADNWKAVRCIYLEGIISPSQVNDIEATLDSHEYFIPTQVGLEPLQSELSGGITEADHVWHTLSFLPPQADLPEGEETFSTVSEFIDMFTSVPFWDIAKESESLGIT